MSFQKGKSGNPDGKKAGTVNKFTKSVKEGILETFKNLQSDKKANLDNWAKENPTEFYKIASKLIPTEVVGTIIYDVSLDFGKGE